MAERKSNRATMRPQLLTVPDAAEILSTSDKTVRRRIKSGELRAIKDGRLVRIDPRDLEDFIRDRRAR
jgi:excisionase family DNA binding protein